MDRVYDIHRWLLGLAPFIWMEATSDSCGIVNLLGTTATISHWNA
jgi:ABC-type phosphate transport system auxiliary subunit